MTDERPIPLSYDRRQRQGWRGHMIDLAFGVAIAVAVFGASLCIMILRAAYIL